MFCQGVGSGGAVAKTTPDPVRKSATLSNKVNLAVEMFQKKLAKIILYRNADPLEMIVTGRVTRRPRVGERGTATKTKLARGIALDLNFGSVSPGLATTSIAVGRECPLNQ